MAIIITYDVPSKHVELKEALSKKGYQDKIAHNNKWIYLPNTTLYHPTKTASTARDEMQAICKTLNVELERCVSTAWTDWAAIWGKPFNK